MKAWICDQCGKQAQVDRADSYNDSLGPVGWFQLMRRHPSGKSTTEHLYSPDCVARAAQAEPELVRG